MNIVKLPKGQRLGQKVLNREGFVMTIVKYRKNDDIDIEFEDGSMLYNKQYSNFIRGLYKKPLEARVGLTFTSHQGCVYKIISILKENGVVRYLVEFQDDYKYKKVSDWRECRKGSINNPYFKSIFNIGYLGVGIYDSKNSKSAYKSWYKMISRCYNVNNEHYCAYGGRGVRVCDEWHNFQNFAKWYYENSYPCIEGLEVDKDILKAKYYSPQTCLLIPSSINKLFIGIPNSINKNNPIGITRKDSGNFTVYVSVEGKQKCFGTFDTIEEAISIYKDKKELNIKNSLIKYKNIIPSKIYDAIDNYSITLEIVEVIPTK